MHASRKAFTIVLIFALSTGGFLIEPQHAQAANTIIFLTSNTGTCGTNCWRVPSDWNATSNTIEVIGGGGGGSTGGNAGSGGGGGGAYSVVTNLSTSTIFAGGTVTYSVGASGGAGANGGDSYFNRPTGASATCSAPNMSLCAKGGVGATSVTGAATTSKANNVPANAGANGGKGGTGNSTGDHGGGGGGAGGPHGDGRTGGDSFNITAQGAGGGGGADGGHEGKTGLAAAGGAGGTNRSAGGSGAGATSGANAQAGTTGGGGGGGFGSALARASGAIGSTGEVLWTQTSPSATAGPGGGGGGEGSVTSGSFAGASGGAGGPYGGGGGGGEDLAGSGGAGLIVITYAPFAAPSVTSRAAVSTQPAIVQFFGQITAIGGGNATSRGFAISTDSTLAAGVSTTTDSGSFGVTNFSYSSTTLVANTTYYYRAYALNPNQGYGAINSFSTGNTTPKRIMRLFEGYRIKLIGGTNTGKLKIIGS